MSPRRRWLVVAWWLVAPVARGLPELKKRFCVGGHFLRFGAYHICCPGSCGSCVEAEACRSAEPGALACCPISGVLATHRRCKRRRDEACVVHDSDEDFFPEGSAAAAAAAPASTDLSRYDDDGSGPVARRSGTLDAEERLVHVAVAGDRAHSVGLAATVASIFGAARDPGRVRAHVVVPARGGAEREALRRALACAAGKRHGSQVHVVDFDAATSLANVTLRAPRGPSYGNLRSPLNFARFYLAALLPEAPKVVYLDADAVAARDVADLYDSALTDDARGAVVAAAPRRDQRVCYDANASRPGVFYCDAPRAKAALAALGAKRPDRDLEAFNAGVAVIHLARWRRLDLTAAFEAAMRAHATEGPLWRLGSNPPLILLAKGRFEALDPRWNCDGLGWKRPTDLNRACLANGAFVWHWSGPKKPWTTHGLYRNLWWPHVRDARCLAALPGDGPLDDADSSSSS